MNIADELERLQSLRERGVLSDAEFTQAKARVLGGGAAGANASALNRLRRSQSDRMISGVCGGLGRYTSVPSWIWRVLFCLFVVCFGFGILLYVLLWLFMPLEA